MKKKFENKLFKKYPTLFPNGRKVDPRQSLMCFGFCFSDGWYDLVDKLCSDIVKMENGDKVVVIQAKEKFGGLRFYVNSATSEIFERIDEAEEESFKVCEWCGKPGKLRMKRHWITLCDSCWAKRKKELGTN